MLPLALEFPPVSHVTEWPSIFGGDGPLAVNKVVILMWISVALIFGLFMVAGRARRLVPQGAQNFAEAIWDFVRDGIVLQTMGPEGLKFMPFLVMMFCFIFVTNIWEVIPVAQMPVNARIALPAYMAVLVWVIFNFMGVLKQGFFGYLKSVCFPPGVPKALYILVTPIEFVSTFIVRPLSLSVRLFANMLAGHLLLVSFIVITAALFTVGPSLAIWPVSFGLLVALTGFEVLVAVLQAFIFTILTAVYIGGAMHPEH
ncbi:MAG TPA: F0F1 ATP synthase subunit A [Acidimicrobiales bacterium]|jgi:F-type H+-transporting ATPase subunit a|nr:F0F1 ATP synthase subunit A [Acidimicrobiales bacterium]